MRLGETTGSRLLLFGGLYFAQGVPWGFVTGGLLMRLTEQGVTAATLGSLVGLAYAPYVAKPLAAPLVDLARRRRPLLLGTELAMAVSLLLLSGLSPLAAPVLFAVVLVAHNACAALQDVATDALAVELLPAGERGRANGVMTAAKYAGVTVGTGGLALVISSAGWRVACLGAAALLLVPAVLVLWAVEPARSINRAAVGRDAVRAFATRPALLGAAFVLLASMSDQFLTPTVFPLLRRQLAYPEAFMARVIGLSALAATAGALLGGFVSDRVGRRRTIAIGVVVVAAVHLAFAAAAPWWSHGAVVLAYVAAGGVAGGTVFAATLALCMDLTDRRVGATHFQLYMALINVRLATASFLGGRVAGSLGAPAMLALAAALELAPLALLAMVRPAPRGGGERAP